MTAQRQFFPTFISADSVSAKPPQFPAEPRTPDGQTGILLLDEENCLPFGVPIKVIGLGGVGFHAVENMIASGLGNIAGVEFICADTEAPLLSCSRAHKTIFLGVNGHSAGDSPDPGRQAAEQNEVEIRNGGLRCSGTENRVKQSI